MKNNIALIGFMGVGKSAVGKVLAEQMGKKYIEVDSLITQKTGKSIPQIFCEDGEVTFREKEIEVIKEVASKSDQVIDCGGGVVLNRINIDRLKQNAVIIWLTASVGVISKRTLSDGDGRPLLRNKNRNFDIRSLLRSRKPYYEQAAEITVDTSEQGIESVVKQIMEQLEIDENID